MRTCQRCEQTEDEVPLLEHHILYKAKYPYFRDVSENLVTLCWNCHRALHANSWYISEIGIDVEQLEKELNEKYISEIENKKADIQEIKLSKTKIKDFVDKVFDPWD